MLKKILIGVPVVLLVIVLVLVGIVAMQPNEFSLQRSATISAPPPVVFAQVNDFHNWKNWSPWEKLDPQLKRTYDGTPEGTGAVYTWTGNQEVGEGKMTILESRSPEVVKIKLEFIKPFQATNATEFTFKPQGDQTNVTWTMTGHNDFMMKAVHLCMNMDKMVGTDFEKGLAALKATAEAQAKQAAGSKPVVPSGDDNTVEKPIGPTPDEKK